MTPTELADALDRQIMPHDSDDPCEDCDTLRQASHALRRLGRVEAAWAQCDQTCSGDCLAWGASSPCRCGMEALRAALEEG